MADDPQDFPLNAGEEYVQLCDLLKVTGLTDSGGAAKIVIAAGEVTVDGAVDTRKRAKIRAGQVVGYAGKRVRVAAGPTE